MMTIVGRKLLYHRGIDDASGTYVTDYVEAGVCLLLALHLGATLRARRARLGGGLNPRPTVAVVAMLFSISMSALLGGLTHQYLQQVGSLVKDHLSLLLLIRRASGALRKPASRPAAAATLNAALNGFETRLKRLGLTWRDIGPVLSSLPCPSVMGDLRLTTVFHQQGTHARHVT